MQHRSTLLAVFLGLGSASQLPGQSPAPHPLDPLSASEISQAVATLRQSGHMTAQSRFGTITVQPRPKSGTPARAARIVGFDWTRNEAFVAVVDLAPARVETWTVVDSEPPMRLLIIRRSEEIAHADPRWIAAMHSRGIDTSRVSIIVDPPERSKLPRKGTDRVVNAYVFLRDGIPNALSVDGLTMEVNLTQSRLDSFSDPGAPLARGDSAAVKALASPRPALPPIIAQQPNGASVRVSGNEITWDRWRLRVGVDPRRGLEIHEVSFDDGGRLRSVLYSGSVSEVVAPYGDPSFAHWYPRDEGDYGMGIYSQTSAVTGSDAPPNAIFLSSTMHDALGRPVTVPRAIAIYERDGGILWRHANLSRRARQLVISSESTIDNYDYQFNWILNQDGAIEGEVILSGVMNVGGTGRTRDTDDLAGHDAFGHLVAPGINAPNHQHFFSYRLDLDVDGVANTVYSAESHAPPEGQNRRGDYIAMTQRPLTMERDAVSDVSFDSARTWRVVSPHETNALGQHTGYTLIPGAATPAFALATSDPMRTAGFIAHQLWVTPYSPDELYAAGEFQNLAPVDQGLPTWTRANRSIADTDVVLWYTLGITHIPRAEDWPYMPAHRGSFRLVPTGFFARNPALDAPPSERR